MYTETFTIKSTFATIPTLAITEAHPTYRGSSIFKNPSLLALATGTIVTIDLVTRNILSIIS